MAGNVVGELARTRVEDCYQCGKCTAGCPVAELMDVTPHQIMRLAQVGDLGRAAASGAVWVCVGCQTCSQRCPKGVDPAAVMDAFRQLSLERGEASGSATRTIAFQRAFLDNIRRHGRLHELELVWRFKTTAFAADRRLPLLFQDASLAPRMARRHKLHLRGERVRDRGVVDRIFECCLGRN